MVTIVGVVALASACASGSAPATTAGIVSTPSSVVTTSSSPVTIPTVDTTAVPATTATTQSPIVTADCPTVDVILVASDDVLNVHVAPDPNSQTLFTIPYAATTIYRTTTAAAMYNGTEWWEIHEPVGQNVGWASSFFLTCAQSGFGSSPQPAAILAGLGELAAGSLSAPAWVDIVSPYGLTVEHFDAVTKHWPASQDPFSDGTIYPWATEAGGSNSLQATFSTQIGGLWLDSVLNDTVGVAPGAPLIDQPQQGQEAAPPWAPAIFTNLHYLSTFDPGDDPNNAGLDWRTVYTYFDWTPNIGWRLRALSFDSWSP